MTDYYQRLGQSSRICVRLFRSRWNPIAPSLREHSCITLDRLSINKYWGTGSKSIEPEAMFPMKTLSLKIDMSLKNISVFNIC